LRGPFPGLALQRFFCTFGRVRRASAFADYYFSPAIGYQKCLWHIARLAVLYRLEPWLYMPNTEDGSKVAVDSDGYTAQRPRDAEVV